MSYYLRSSVRTRGLSGVKMKSSLSVLILLLAISPVVLAQQEPAHKLVEFHMALLKRGPKFTAAENEETKRLRQEHVKYVLSLFDSGKAIIAGPFTDFAQSPQRKRRRGLKQVQRWRLDSTLRKCIHGGRKIYSGSLRSR
jgi:hypothetical protein